jgi:drug/metabolite transporter (DMT)-like permease
VLLWASAFPAIAVAVPRLGPVGLSVARLAVAFAGSAVIAVSHGLGFGTAALIVLAAAVVQAVFHTAQKPLLARYTGFEVTVYAMWAGTLFILPWAGALARALPHAGAGAIGAAVFLGVAPSAIGFAAWAYAMARMDVGRATTALYLVPAAAILIALVWLGQVPGPLELAGGGIALAGVVLASREPRHPAMINTGGENVASRDAEEVIYE